MQRTTVLALAWLALSWSAAATAQPMANMPGMKPAAPATPAPPAVPKIPGALTASSASTPDYKQAMDKMMAGMGAPYSGDTDHDFVTHMIPHHQGAIDMAETELKYGTDARLKQLAARIISAQQREIAFMQAWLDKHPHPKQLGDGAPPNMQVK